MIPGKPGKRLVAQLDILVFPAPPEGLAVAPCLECSGTLRLSQPDLEMPERLIGACPSCKQWYLIDLIEDLDAGVIAGLPGRHVIRSLSAGPGDVAKPGSSGPST
jgi:hypothetical protein